jgi:hypothetical protein
MTMLEYLVFGGLAVAGVYTIVRLFQGWLRTVRSDGANEARKDIGES